jgi:hypothetical protein
MAPRVEVNTNLPAHQGIQKGNVIRFLPIKRAVRIHPWTRARLTRCRLLTPLKWRKTSWTRTTQQMPQCCRCCVHPTAVLSWQRTLCWLSNSKAVSTYNIRSYRVANTFLYNCRRFVYGAVFSKDATVRNCVFSRVSLKYLGIHDLCA